MDPITVQDVVEWKLPGLEGDNTAYIVTMLQEDEAEARFQDMTKNAEYKETICRLLLRDSYKNLGYEHLERLSNELIYMLYVLRGPDYEPPPIIEVQSGESETSKGRNEKSRKEKKLRPQRDANGKIIRGRLLHFALIAQ